MESGVCRCCYTLCKDLLWGYLNDLGLMKPNGLSWWSGLGCILRPGRGQSIIGVEENTFPCRHTVRWRSRGRAGRPVQRGQKLFALRQTESLGLSPEGVSSGNWPRVAAWGPSLQLLLEPWACAVCPLPHPRSVQPVALNAFLVQQELWKDFKAIKSE